jgi:tripartite-type tricarboxylate transporter receptor subunit TctC
MTKNSFIFWVPYAAGGPALDQTVVIQNVPGASSTHGALALTRAAADGYTLALLPSTL